MAGWKDRVVAATVKLTRLKGQGVLVPGGFVLTAAHCIHWDGAGGMVLGDEYLEPIQTRSGAKFRLSAVAVDVVADIAVLGEPDNQEFLYDVEAFEIWRESTKPVTVGGRVLEVGEECRAHVLRHIGGWTSATLRRYGMPGSAPVPSVWIGADKPIRGGTSGGPIVDGRGQLIGVVSNAGGTVNDTREGTMPVARLALPQWVWMRISKEVA